MEEFLRRIPKVELHCHLEGAVRPETLADLARRNGVPLPADRAEDLYRYQDLAGFLEILTSSCVALWSVARTSPGSPTSRLRMASSPGTSATERCSLTQPSTPDAGSDIQSSSMVCSMAYGQPSPTSGSKAAASPRCTGKIPSAQPSRCSRTSSVSAETKLSVSGWTATSFGIPREVHRGVPQGRECRTSIDRSHGPRLPGVIRDDLS